MSSSKQARIEFEMYDGTKADDYSLQNAVQLMRPARFALADEIYATPLLTMVDVLSPRSK